MPLPAALAAKLAKRGIITPKQKPPEPVKKLDFKGVSTCPNKSNVFHECNHWCEIHWKGLHTPDPKYVRNMQKLIAKYPLPNNWMEIFDKGIGRYYYWNMENGLVTWLPPKHPKAVLTKSASKLREKRVQEQKEKKVRERQEASKKERENEKSSDKERDRDSDDDRGYRSKYSDRRDRDRDRDDRRSKRDREDRHRRDRDKRAKRDDQLDPMDPAAYSDVPQGTWSDGLETNKARADNTASGVLFQQRPYPAPGAVLAANKEKEEKERRK